MVDLTTVLHYDTPCRSYVHALSACGRSTGLGAVSNISQRRKAPLSTIAATVQSEFRA